MNILKQKQHFKRLDEKLESLCKVKFSIREGSNGTLLNSLIKLERLIWNDYIELLQNEQKIKILERKQHFNLLDEKLESLFKVKTSILEGSNGTLLNSLEKLEQLIWGDFIELLQDKQKMH